MNILRPVCDASPAAEGWRGQAEARSVYGDYTNVARDGVFGDGSGFQARGRIAVEVEERSTLGAAILGVAQSATVGENESIILNVFSFWQRRCCYTPM